MNPAELLKSDPACYHAVIAIERDRVAAHLQAAQATGETALAFSAIGDGRSFEICQEAYLTAGRARRAETLRQLDSDMAHDAIQGATSPPAGGGGGGGAEADHGDAVAARVAQLMGHKPKATVSP